MGSTTTGKGSTRKSAAANATVREPVTKTRLLVIAPSHPALHPTDAGSAAYNLFTALRTHPAFDVRWLSGVGANERQLHGGTPFQAIDGRPDELLFHGADFDTFLQSHNTKGFLYNDFSQLLAQWQPDVVHFHHSAGIGIEAVQVARQTLPAAVIVYTLHDYRLLCHNGGRLVQTGGEALCPGAAAARCHQCFPAIPLTDFKVRETFIKAHLGNVDTFITATETVAAQFIRWGIAQQKIAVLPNIPAAEPTAPFRQLLSGERRRAIGVFVQPDALDSVLRLLQAFDLLRDQGIEDVQLHLFGSVGVAAGESDVALRHLLQKHAASICHHEHYRAEQLPALIARVDWIVAPDIRCDVPDAVVQAVRSHRRPLLCPDIGGLAEQLSNGAGALHVDATTAVSLATHLGHALQAEGLWEKLLAGIAAPERRDASTLQHIRLYQSLTQR